MNREQKLIAVLAPLVKIADWYDDNQMDEHRPEWNDGKNPADIILLAGRGGATLLSVSDCFAARDALKHAKGVIENTPIQDDIDYGENISWAETQQLKALGREWNIDEPTTVPRQAVLFFDTENALFFGDLTYDEKTLTYRGTVINGGWTMTYVEGEEGALQVNDEYDRIQTKLRHIVDVSGYISDQENRLWYNYDYNDVIDGAKSLVLQRATI